MAERFTALYIKHLEISSDCPKCGRETGVDAGGRVADDLPYETEFSCNEEDEKNKGCGHTWTVEFSVKLTQGEDT